MDEDQGEKEKKNPSGESPGNVKKKRAPRVIKEPKNLPKTRGKGNRKRALPRTTDLLPKKKVTFGEKSEWMPSFNNYEDFSQKTLKSSDGFMIILNQDGLIVFATTYTFFLLGYTAESIVGKNVLDLIPDQEKRSVLENISLCIPLSKSVGKHITFGCHLRRNVEYGCGSAYQYANIIMNVIDISNDSSLYFTRIYQSQYATNPSLLLEDKFYLVGFVCVIRSQILRELCNVKDKEEVDAANNLDKYMKCRLPQIEDGSKTFKTEAVCADPEASISSDLDVAVTVEKTGQHTSSNTSTDSSASYQEFTSDWKALVRKYVCALDMEEMDRTEKIFEKWRQKYKTEKKDLKPEEIAVPMKVKEKQHMEKEEAEQVQAMECAEQAETMDQTDKKMGPAEEPEENMSMEEVEVFVPLSEDPIGEVEWAIECAEQAEPMDQADKKMGPAEEPKENMCMEEVEAFVPLKEDLIEEAERAMECAEQAEPIDEADKKMGPAEEPKDNMSMEEEEAFVPLKEDPTEEAERANKCAEQAEPMDQADKKMEPAEEPKENMSMEEVEAFVPLSEDPIEEAERANQCAEQAESMNQADKKMEPAEEPKENMSMEEVEAFVPLKEDLIEEAERAMECAEQAEPIDEADKKMGPAEEPKENMSMEEVEAFAPLSEDPIEEAERANQCAEQAEPMDQADKKMEPAEEPKENMSMEEVEAFVPLKEDHIEETERANQCAEQAESMNQADKKMEPAEEPKENMSMEDVEAFVPLKEDPIEEAEPGTMEEPKEAEMRAMSHATQIDESFVPVTAPIATTKLALEDSTKVLQDNIQYSEEKLEETKKLLETMQEPTLETQISIPVTCQSSASQTLEAVTLNGKRERPDSDVHKSKNSHALSPSHTITTEKLGEPCDISTQVQLPNEEPQDPPSTGAAQDPAYITAESKTQILLENL